MRALNGETVIVDDALLPMLSQHVWRANPYGEKKYVTTNIAGKTTYIHRLITSAPKGTHVDHINGDTLDNRISNLRVCTPAENFRNQKIHKNNTSGRKGVWFDKRYKSRKWQAEIMLDRKKIYIAGFDDIEEAASAYDSVALQLFGDYALTNIGVL